MTRFQHTLEEVTLFGHRDTNRNDWGRSCARMGLGNRIDTRDVELHHLTGAQSRDVRLSENVEVVSICNPRDFGVELVDSVHSFFDNLLSPKIACGNPVIKELHLTSTFSDLSDDFCWIEAHTFANIMRKIGGIWALSIHQNGRLDFEPWEMTQRHAETLKLLSVYTTVTLSDAQLQALTHDLPKLEGLGLEIPVFFTLWDVSD